MRKILIVTPTLRSGGGVIRGLQNMLALLPANRYEVSVLPMGVSDGDNVVLTNCEVLPEHFLLTATTAVYAQTKGYKYRRGLKFVKAFLSLAGKLKKRGNIENLLFRNVAKKYVGYDIVIAYQEGPCTRFVQYIDAPYRIAWIHCDYSEYKKICPYDEEGVYAKYQRIVCVSKFTLHNFQEIYPQLKNRSLYIYNLLDKDFICQSAFEECVDSKKNKKIRLISVGRLHPVKQFHLIPGIINQMQAIGATDFEWVLIGSGTNSEEFDLLLSEAKRLNVGEKYFLYLGPKYNPYPYIKNSDILVSTSLSEACPFVVNEARVLDVPVVSNNYPSISEFISDGINGRIISIDNMAEVLAGLVMQFGLLDKLKDGIKKDNYDNNYIIDQICKLLDVKC